MVKELLGDYARTLMKRQGHDDNYDIAFRHFVLQSGQRREIEAANEVFILMEPVTGLSIKSEFGFFDLSFDRTDELQYVHEGFIVLQNYSPATVHVRFVQVTPLLKSKANNGKHD